MFRVKELNSLTIFVFLAIVLSSCSLSHNSSSRTSLDSMALEELKSDNKVKSSTVKIITKVHKYYGEGCKTNNQCYFEIKHNKKKNNQKSSFLKVILADSGKCTENDKKTTDENCLRFDSTNKILGPDGLKINLKHFDPAIFEGARVKISAEQRNDGSLIINESSEDQYIQIISLNKRAGKYRKKLKIFNTKNVLLLYKYRFEKYLSPKNLSKVNKPKLKIIRDMLLTNSVHNTSSSVQYKKGQQIVSDQVIRGSFEKIYSSSLKMRKNTPYWLISESWEDYENSRIIEVKSVFDTTLKLKKVYMNIKQ